MGDLADKLDGEARNLMLGDIKRMNELSEQESEGDTREDASIEMMSLAFSRMSDEVLQLIDAKTEDMKSARDEAITANANRSQFFANMSHELRTPLNAIIGYSEMLEEECEDMGHDDLLPDVQRINSSGRHLLTLINDVLDMQKIEAGKMEIYPTAFDIDGTIEMLNAINMPLSEKTGNA
jgi:signal transduction histidine kinase